MSKELSWSIIKAIALNTFRETVRDKLLYSLLAFAGLAIAASLLAGSVSLGQDLRVIQNFSQTAILVFLLLITVLTSTQLVYREIERKTIYISLSKPITRSSFYLGKFLGLSLTVAISALIMAAIFLILIYVKGNYFSVSALWSVGFILLEAWLLISVGLLFSSFTSPLSSAIYTFGIALIGHSSGTIWLLSEKSSPAIKYILQSIYYIFPNLEKFNLRNEVVYNFLPSTAQVLTTLGYFAAFTSALLVLGILIFRKDEF